MVENVDDAVAATHVEIAEDEYEYEYIELEDGEELPEGTEYEYIEVSGEDEDIVNEDLSSLVAAFPQESIVEPAPTPAPVSTPAPISILEVSEPILSTPPVRTIQENPNPISEPSYEPITSELPSPEVSLASYAVAEEMQNPALSITQIADEDLNALLDDVDEISEISTTELLSDDGQDFEENNFWAPNIEDIKEISIDDMLGMNDEKKEDAKFSKDIEEISLSDLTNVKKEPEVIEEIAVDILLADIPEPVIEPISAPVIEPIPEPVVEPILEPVIEPILEPVIEPISAPVIEPISAPVIEPISAPVIEPILEPVIEPILEPVIEPILEPVIEPILEPVIEPKIMREVDEVIIQEIENVKFVINNLTSEFYEQLSNEGKVISSACGMQFFDASRTQGLLLNYAEKELVNWSLVIFNQNIIPVDMELQSMHLPMEQNAVRFTQVIKNGEKKLELYNAEQYNFEDPQGGFVKAKSHFIYGSVDKNTGMIVNDYINIPLFDKGGKVIVFDAPVSGMLSGSNGTIAFFVNVSRIGVAESAESEEDIEKALMKAAKWYSGSLSDKYFEFSSSSQSAEFVGNDEINSIHVNLGNSTYGWNVTFDNAVMMSLKDVQEFQVKHAKLPSSNGVIVHGSLKLTFSNVERIVVYQTPQYFAYGKAGN